MDLADELRKNITMTYYESGHMMYVCKTAHQKFRKDMEDFIRKALERKDNYAAFEELKRSLKKK